VASAPSAQVPFTVILTFVIVSAGISLILLMGGIA
jgi:hypothetical protein